MPPLVELVGSEIREEYVMINRRFLVAVKPLKFGSIVVEQNPPKMCIINNKVYFKNPTDLESLATLESCCAL